jgi:mRNA interferase HigB
MEAPGDERRIRAIRDAEIARVKRVDSHTVAELNLWCKTCRSASWSNLFDVRRNFPDVDQVGNVLIFNIRHNRYRLITFVVYGKQKLYVKTLLAHKEYDRKEWMKWA